MKFTNPLPDPIAAATLVKKEWLQLIRIEGIDTAKQFMEMCRIRDISPSSHCDVEQFLSAGHSALRTYIASRMGEQLQESDY